MKKLFIILAAAMLVMGAAATAGANSVTSLNLTFYANANADGDTGVVIPSGIEIGIDLGDAGDWADLTDFNTGVTIDSFGASVNTGWEDVLVAGYAASTVIDYGTYSTTNSWYVTGADAGASFGTYVTAVVSIVNGAYPNSYNEFNWSTNENGFVQQLGGGAVDPTGSTLDTNMSPIADGINLALYGATSSATGYYAPSLEETDLALLGYLNLSLNDGGEVIVNAVASPVPVPAAVWLMATGLLGVLGIRRKN